MSAMFKILFLSSVIPARDNINSWIFSGAAFELSWMQKSENSRLVTETSTPVRRHRTNQPVSCHLLKLTGLVSKDTAVWGRVNVFTDRTVRWYRMGFTREQKN